MVLDETPILIDRVAGGPALYSGKHKKHGMNLQVIAGPRRGHSGGVGGAPSAVHHTEAACGGLRCRQLRPPHYEADTGRIRCRSA